MKNFFIKRMIKNLTDLQIIFLSFLFVVILGGSILSLPISSRTGEYTSFVDSLFTAISATCVTGLAVLDTSTYWSFFWSSYYFDFDTGWRARLYDLSC
ncbi:Potassium/sodium uptake protein NtpJ [Lactococcus formosensis]|nr:Potassium/sodium uptake protein NtpJ [Lactococcus formosensis]